MDRRVTLIAVALSACAAPQSAGPLVPSALLAGRTAGEPQRCVAIQSGTALRVDENDRHLLVYGNGNVLWATRLPNGCGLAVNDVPVFEPTGSYYCRGDIVRSVDQVSGIPGPTCVLGDFTPYTR